MCHSRTHATHLLFTCLQESFPYAFLLARPLHANELEMIRATLYAGTEDVLVEAVVGFQHLVSHYHVRQRSYRKKHVRTHLRPIVTSGLIQLLHKLVPPHVELFLTVAF